MRKYDLRQEPCLVREYDIASLEDNRDNHFSRMEGEKWEEFVGSIREFGIVSPLIIRPRPGHPGRYEILAGHNRKNGAKEAGLQTVPCIAVEVDDVDASVLIGITNRQREEVTDLEWGWTYRTTLETLKSQNEQEPHPHGARSIDLVAEKYGISRRTAQRKIRLTYLIPQLYALGQKEKYSQKMLIDLSYLPPEIQTNIVQAVVIEGAALTESVCAHLRHETQEHSLTINDVLRICGSDAANKKTNREGRRVNCSLPVCLFPGALPQKKRTAYAEAALKYILDRGIALDLL